MKTIRIKTPLIVLEFLSQMDLQRGSKRQPAFEKPTVLRRHLHTQDFIVDRDHPARASKAFMSKAADRVLGVHGFVTPVLCYR
jgi:hypothetical protein